MNEVLLNKNSTKRTIIQLIGTRKNQSIKQLFEQLEKENRSIPYQAVHKAVQQLEKEGIIEKRSNQFSIQKEWVENTEKLIEQIKKTNQQGLAKSQNSKPFTA